MLLRGYDAVTVVGTYDVLPTDDTSRLSCVEVLLSVHNARLRSASVSRVRPQLPTSPLVREKRPAPFQIT